MPLSEDLNLDWDGHYELDYEDYSFCKYCGVYIEESKGKWFDEEGKGHCLGSKQKHQPEE